MTTRIKCWEWFEMPLNKVPYGRFGLAVIKDVVEPTVYKDTFDRNSVTKRWDRCVPERAGRSLNVCAGWESERRDVYLKGTCTRVATTLLDFTRPLEPLNPGLLCRRLRHGK